EQLLVDGASEATDLAIELLSIIGSPGTAMAMCEGIISIGTRQPALLNPRMADPLLNLLGGDNQTLSSRAASALSFFRDGEVAERLGALAADSRQTIARRLAAIDALAANTDRRAVVSEFIKLATTGEPMVVARALDALRGASRVDYGNDVAAWQTWWAKQQAQSNEEWLLDRLELSAQRSAALRGEIIALRHEANLRNDLLTRRMNELLRENYRLTTQQAQRDALLQKWLSDEMDVFRLSALTLVREQITEGTKPAPPVREAVNACFSHPTPAVRIAALEIVGFLKDPQDATTVLTLLNVENDPDVREAVLRVLGRLDNPSAIESLVAELNKTDALPGCVREAARALGTLCAAGQTPAETIATAIEPLRTRFAAASPDDVRLKEALLGAMAGIGHPDFLPNFAENLSSDSPELVLAAIHGLIVVKDQSSLDRVRSHLMHEDSRVRQRAAEAVGALGSEPAHLEALVDRLSPNIEPNAGVRDAAWIGFRKILDQHPAAVRLQWVDRLEHLPDRRLALLEQLIGTWSASNPAPPELPRARDKIATFLIGQQRYTAAIPHLQDLRKSYLAAGDPLARHAGIILLQAYLQAGRHERVPELIDELADGADSSTRTAIRDVVLPYLEATIINDDSVAAPLIERLISLESLGPEWPTQLEQIQSQIRVPDTEIPSEESEP
ncbi:MAG: HEAT repeat domain-containing protein, partial [Planctomycetes bacterium]|nr:HEAT repeat domain-containing protein [Planctomycetota bacterium]